MDMGREDRESERDREGWWPGEGEARSLLKVSRADADCAEGNEDGGCFVGEAGAGDAGPGDAVLDGGCFCKWAPPPHCDMKDRTAAGAVLVHVGRDTAGAGEGAQKHSEGRPHSFTSLGTPHDGRLVAGTHSASFR
jgi:hypothetical protein